MSEFKRLDFLGSAPVWSSTVYTTVNIALVQSVRNAFDALKSMNCRKLEETGKRKKNSFTASFRARHASIHVADWWHIGSTISKTTKIIVLELWLRAFSLLPRRCIHPGEVRSPVDCVFF